MCQEGELVLSNDYDGKSGCGTRPLVCANALGEKKSKKISETRVIIWVVVVGALVLLSLFCATVISQYSKHALSGVGSFSDDR